MLGCAEPFQHSQDVSRRRVDVMAIAPSDAEVVQGQEARYVWRSVGEIGEGAVFLLAANAVGLALTFMGCVDRLAEEMGGGGNSHGGGAQRWVRAQKEMLFAAEKSGRLGASLVDNSLGTKRRFGSWSDLMQQDARAQSMLKDSPRGNTQR